MPRKPRPKSAAERELKEQVTRKLITALARQFDLSQKEATELYNSLDLEDAQDLGVDEVNDIIRAKVDEIKRARRN